MQSSCIRKSYADEPMRVVVVLVAVVGGLGWVGGVGVWGGWTGRRVWLPSADSAWDFFSSAGPEMCKQFHCGSVY